MTKRRTSGVQRRSRASEAAMNRRLGTSGPSIDPRILGIIGFLLVGIVVVVIALLQTGPKGGKFVGERQAEEGRGHVADGTPDMQYKSLPATSGPHWVTPANWGIYGPDQPGQYAAPLPEPQSVHNLEHGGTVIWYEPTKIAPADLQKLTDFVRGQLSGARFKIILAPWTGEEFGHPIAAVAWDWRLYLDEANTDALEQFIEAHYQQSPEPNGGPGRPAVQ
jgi:hypothetical protein